MTAMTPSHQPSWSMIQRDNKRVPVVKVRVNAYAVLLAPRVRTAPVRVLL